MATLQSVDYNEYNKLHQGRKIKALELTRILKILDDLHLANEKCKRITNLWHLLSSIHSVFENPLVSFRKILNFTSLLVISPEWSLEVDHELKLRLMRALGACAQMFPLTASQCASLMVAIFDPWGGCSSPTQLEDDKILRFLETEGPEMLSARIEALYHKGLHDAAITLCERCLEHFAFYNEIFHPPGDGGGGTSKYRFNPYVHFVTWKLLFCLTEEDGCRQNLDTKFFFRQVENLSCHEGIYLVSFLLNKCPTLALEAASTLMHIFLLRDVVRPGKFCCTRELMATWLALQLKLGVSVAEIEKTLRRLMTNYAFSSSHFYILVEVLNHKFGYQLLHLYIEMYIRALTSDRNYLEMALENKSNPEEAAILSGYIATALTTLATIFPRRHIKLAQQCALTAFSLEPTEPRLNLLQMLIRGDAGNNEASQPLSLNPNCTCGGRCTTPTEELETNGSGGCKEGGEMPTYMYPCPHPILDTVIKGVPYQLMIDLTSLLEGMRSHLLALGDTWREVSPIFHDYLKNFGWAGGNGYPLDQASDSEDSLASPGFMCPEREGKKSSLSGLVHSNIMAPRLKSHLLMLKKKSVKMSMGKPKKVNASPSLLSKEKGAEEKNETSFIKSEMAMTPESLTKKISEGEEALSKPKKNNHLDLNKKEKVNVPKSKKKNDSRSLFRVETPKDLSVKPESVPPQPMEIDASLTFVDQKIEEQKDTNNQNPLSSFNKDFFQPVKSEPLNFPNENITPPPPYIRMDQKPLVLLESNLAETSSLQTQRKPSFTSLVTPLIVRSKSQFPIPESKPIETMQSQKRDSPKPLGYTPEMKPLLSKSENYVKLNENKQKLTTNEQKRQEEALILEKIFGPGFDSKSSSDSSKSPKQDDSQGLPSKSMEESGVHHVGSSDTDIGATPQIRKAQKFNCPIPYIKNLIEHALKKHQRSIPISIRDKQKNEMRTLSIPVSQKLYNQLQKKHSGQITIVDVHGDGKHDSSDGKEGDTFLPGNILNLTSYTVVSANTIVRPVHSSQGSQLPFSPVIKSVGSSNESSLIKLGSSQSSVPNTSVPNTLPSYTQIKAKQQPAAEASSFYNMNQSNFNGNSEDKIKSTNFFAAGFDNKPSNVLVLNNLPPSNRPPSFQSGTNPLILAPVKDHSPVTTSRPLTSPTVIHVTTSTNMGPSLDQNLLETSHSPSLPAQDLYDTLASSNPKTITTTNLTNQPSSSHPSKTDPTSKDDTLGMDLSTKESWKVASSSNQEINFTDDASGMSLFDNPSHQPSQGSQFSQYPSDLLDTPNYSSTDLNQFASNYEDLNFTPEHQQQVTQQIATSQSGHHFGSHPSQQPKSSHYPSTPNKSSLQPLKRDASDQLFSDPTRNFSQSLATSTSEFHYGSNQYSVPASPQMQHKVEVPSSTSTQPLPAFGSGGGFESQAAAKFGPYPYQQHGNFPQQKFYPPAPHQESKQEELSAKPLPSHEPNKLISQLLNNDTSPQKTFSPQPANYYSPAPSPFQESGVSPKTSPNLAADGTSSASAESRSQDDSPRPPPKRRRRETPVFCGICRGKLCSFSGLKRHIRTVHKNLNFSSQEEIDELANKFLNNESFTPKIPPANSDDKGDGKSLRKESLSELSVQSDSQDSMKKNLYSHYQSPSSNEPNDITHFSSNASASASSASFPDPSKASTSPTTAYIDRLYQEFDLQPTYPANDLSFDNNPPRSHSKQLPANSYETQQYNLPDTTKKEPGNMFNPPNLFPTANSPQRLNSLTANSPLFLDKSRVSQMEELLGQLEKFESEEMNKSTEGRNFPNEGLSYVPPSSSSTNSASISNFQPQANIEQLPPFSSVTDDKCSFSSLVATSTSLGSHFLQEFNVQEHMISNSRNEIIRTSQGSSNQAPFIQELAAPLSSASQQFDNKDQPYIHHKQALVRKILARKQSENNPPSSETLQNKGQFQNPPLLNQSVAPRPEYKERTPSSNS